MNKQEDTTIARKEHPDLYKKVIKGGVWVFALRIFTQALSMLRLVVLARLLAPEDFGLMGIALLLISILQTFTETGFNAALIQKQKDITPYLNTAWTVNIARGLLLYAVLYFAAPFAANIKIPAEQIPTAVAIIRVTGLAVIIGSLSNIGTVYFQKELNFDKTFVLTSVSNLIGIAASIAVAIVYKNPWALVVGKLANTAIAAAMSYKMHTYKPKLQFQYDKFRELWRFGKWMTAGSVFNFLIKEGDDCLVLIILGAESLGFYQMAYRVSNMPATEITGILGKITFPAYSLINKDISRLSKAFLKTIHYTSLLGFPLGISIFIMAEPFVKIFMGDQWLSIVSPIRLLSLLGMMGTVFSNSSACFQALGKMKIKTIIYSIRVLLMYAIMYPLTVRYGIIGTSVAVLLPAVVVKFISVPVIMNVLGIKFKDFFDAIKYQIYLSSGLGLFLYTFNQFMDFRDFAESPISAALFGINLLIGTVLYFFGTILFDKNIKSYKELVAFNYKKGI